MELPIGLVINRADVGDRRVHDYAARENIAIFLEIPFDREVAETYARGELMVEKRPEWRHLMRSLFEGIQSGLTGGGIRKAAAGSR
jgi:MinD superfamily P-loop ATPase